MELAAQLEVDVPGWTAWLDSHSLISGKLQGIDRASLNVYFQALHGLTEAVFRRALLVGLRVNHVLFKDAEDWLHDHDETPDRKEFPKRFDHLFAIRRTSWADVTLQSESFRCALDLWHDYSKVIRNHLAHAIRSYGHEWLTCAIQIDQILLMEFDRALEPIIGGSLAHDLTKLVPRLPKGIPDQDLPKLTGVKQRKPRPAVSLVSAQLELAQILVMKKK